MNGRLIGEDSLTVRGAELSVPILPDAWKDRLHVAFGAVPDAAEEHAHAREGEELRLVERRALHAGDFYALFPPHDDIHRVRTTSAETSVSIHLLTNDTGCVWRHTFDPGTGAESPFRSGYSNAACESETAPPEGD